MEGRGRDGLRRVGLAGGGDRCVHGTCSVGTVHGSLHRVENSVLRTDWERRDEGWIWVHGDQTALYIAREVSLGPA